MDNNNIIEVCKNNALIYSEQICKPIEKYQNVFPEYFDWADHIASENSNDYVYHLNKTVDDVNKLINIYQKFIPHETLSKWIDNWYNNTIAAAWIHDIGLLEDIDNHGTKSAQYLFNSRNIFDFTEINIEDKIKIGLICIKHNKGWQDAYKATKDILSKNELNILEKYFFEEYTPIWELYFSGQLISTADSMRHRGNILNNNLKQSFQKFLKCRTCKNFYPESMQFFNNECCSKNKPELKILVPHYVDKSLDPKKLNNIDIFNKPETNDKPLDKVDNDITNKDILVLVRNENQIFTRGDMSLSEIDVYYKEDWLDFLKKDAIDCSLLNSSPLYNTVIQVKLDTNNLDAAFFTFYKYIAFFLPDNMCLDEVNYNEYCNNVILFIFSDSEKSFSQLYNVVRKKLEYEEDKKRLSYDDKAIDAIENIIKIFQMWEEPKNVLPVEQINKKLKKIELNYES